MNLRLTVGLLSGIILTTIAGCHHTTHDEDANASIATLVASTEKVIEPVKAEVEQKVVATLTAHPNPVLAADAHSKTERKPYVETEVVRIDTVSTRMVYTIRRRIIEEVDTVSATKVYEIRKKLLKRTISTDTLTEIENQKNTIAFQHNADGSKTETDTAIKSRSSQWKVDLTGTNAPSASLVSSRASKWRVDLSSSPQPASQTPRWKVKLSEQPPQTQAASASVPRWKVNLTPARQPQANQSPNWKVDLAGDKKQQANKPPRWKVDLSEAKGQAHPSVASPSSPKWKVDLTESDAQESPPADTQASRWKVDLRGNQEEPPSQTPHWKVKLTKGNTQQAVDSDNSTATTQKMRP